MNKQLQDFARAELKTGLAELPEENHRTFKLMYARDNGKRSVVDAVAMQINDVVDLARAGSPTMATYSFCI